MRTPPCVSPSSSGEGKHMNALHQEQEEAILEWLRKNNRKPVKEN